MFFQLVFPFNIFFTNLLENCCQILLLLSARLVCYVHRAQSCSAVDCPNTMSNLKSFVVFDMNEDSYILYGAAGFHVFAEGHPLLAVSVLPRAEDVLETLVVGFLIDHPHTALHPDGVAEAEVCVQVGTVATAVIAAALEFLLLKKCDLWQKSKNVYL